MKLNVREKMFFYFHRFKTKLTKKLLKIKIVLKVALIIRVYE